MKHISVNDWIKIEGYTRPNHQRVKGGTQYEDYNDYYLSRDFKDWTLYNNLVINKVKGRTKLKKQGKRAMIKAYLKIKDLN